MAVSSNNVGWARCVARLASTCLSLLAVMTGQAYADPTINSLIGTDERCQSTLSSYSAAMPVQPLYVPSSAGCEAIDPRDTSESELFADNQCRVPVSFKRTDDRAYCASTSSLVGLGSAEGLVEDQWTLSPGSRIDLGVRPLAGVDQPYMQRTRYRQVQTGRGTCELEMRIYKRHPSSTGQRSAIALHGGGWGSRNIGFFLLEYTIPHLVEQGYTVYAPFYRLISPNRGTEACNGARVEDALADTAAALEWVNAQASRIGSSGQPLVFGQSAGAHLATSLLVDHADEVGGAVLFYPPTDLQDWLLRIQAGRYDDPDGVALVERTVRQRPAASADVSATPIPQTSFPGQLAANRVRPPLFVIHGDADNLIEPRHAERLCQAQAGQAFAEIDIPLLSLNSSREIRSCAAFAGDPSSLHLVRGVGHSFDFCLAGVGDDVSKCPAAGTPARATLEQSLAAAFEFAGRLNGQSGSGNPGVDDGGSDGVDKPDSAGGDGTPGGTDGDGMPGGSDGSGMAGGTDGGATSAGSDAGQTPGGADGAGSSDAGPGDGGGPGSGQGSGQGSGAGSSGAGPDSTGNTTATGNGAAQTPNPFETDDNSAGEDNSPIGGMDAAPGNGASPGAATPGVGSGAGSGGSTGAGSLDGWAVLVLALSATLFARPARRLHPIRLPIGHGRPPADTPRLTGRKPD